MPAMRFKQKKHTWTFRNTLLTERRVLLIVAAIKTTFTKQIVTESKSETHPFASNATFLGVSNGHKIFQLLAKFCLCSICSQNLDECSLARARKIFAIARMLGFSLKFA